MGAVILLGVVLGLDSLRASLGLGVVRRGAASRARVALAFALCDGIAPVLGLVLGAAVVESASLWSGWVGPLALGGFGLFTFLTAGREGWEEKGAGAGTTWASIGMPLLLSLDNLVAGFGLGAVRVPIALSALILGTASGAMAMAGLYLGSLVGRAMPTRAERVGGAVLTLLALAMAFDVV
jgi:manganese efflux pump family protein